MESVVVAEQDPEEARVASLRAVYRILHGFMLWRTREWRGGNVLTRRQQQCRRSFDSITGQVHHFALLRGRLLRLHQQQPGLQHPIFSC